MNHMEALDDAGPAVWCALGEDDETAEDPPSPLLPLLTLLTLEDAQDLMLLLAAVLDGGEVDDGFARYLLSNLAGRVPSAE